MHVERQFMLFINNSQDEALLYLSNVREQKCKNKDSQRSQRTSLSLGKRFTGEMTFKRRGCTAVVSSENIPVISSFCKK